MKANQHPLITDFELSKDSSLDSLAAHSHTFDVRSEEVISFFFKKIELIRRREN